MAKRAKSRTFGSRPWLGNRQSYYQTPKVSHAGYSFGSKGEASLFDYLKLREKVGEIINVEVQKHVKLTKAGIVYIADFMAWDCVLEQPVWYEYKGFETEVWKIKKRLWKYYGPGRLEIYYGVPGPKEEIIPEIEL
jgi:hypothetical protein